MRSVVILTFVFATFAICTVNLQGVPESSDPNCKKLEDALQKGKGMQPNKTAMEPQESVWMENALQHNFESVMLHTGICSLIYYYECQISCTTIFLKTRCYKYRMNYYS
uniref:Uncharacterized protein n=1 Tax=Rhipicephalus microplus TaxID=6941 RepID=A0A6G5A2Y8_RHIMP